MGFYGGINYGFGYRGSGSYGGRWKGDQYFYNTRVTNVNRTIIHNVYDTNVTNQRASINRVSFNGGPHGVNARPNSSQLSAARQRGQHRSVRTSGSLVLPPLGGHRNVSQRVEKPGLGILSMQGRARLLGGEFEIHSKSGEGTRIEAWVPLQPVADQLNV